MSLVNDGPTINLNGVEYVSLRQLEMNYDSDGMRITTNPATMEPVNACDKCHRADWRERAAYSLAQAVEFGWLLPR